MSEEQQCDYTPIPQLNAEDDYYSNPRPELHEQEAVRIYKQLRQIGGAEVNAAIDHAIESAAGMRTGQWAMSCAWYGTPLPEDIASMLTSEYGDGYLYERNVASFDGRHIELNVLVGKLPDSIVLEGFSFNHEAKAQEAGISIEEVKRLLIQNFAGLDRDCCGKEVFAFRDELSDEQWHSIMHVTGAGMLIGDWGRGDGFKGVSAEDGDVATSFIEEALGDKASLPHFPGEDLSLLRERNDG